MAKPRSLAIIGIGGFGREVIEIIRAANEISNEIWQPILYDDNPSSANIAKASMAGLPFRGAVSEMLHDRTVRHAVIAIGDPQVRAKIVWRLPETLDFPVLIHPSATVGHSVSLGPGTIVAAGARLSSDITIGRHVQIDQNATIGHDCVIEDFARLNPQACISGDVLVGAHSLVGANATVIQRLQIGASATVGAGAVVTRDVSPSRVVKGVPAR